MTSRFAARGTGRDIETGNVFMPKFDEHGLISCVVTDAKDGAVLMFAHMNEDALARTIESGDAWFWSRSRKELWRKGETSGNTLKLEALFVDCDQDALWMKVRVAGDGVACHTGARSCFYRRIPVQPSTAAPVNLVAADK